MIPDIGTKIFISLRKIIFPFVKIKQYIPQGGKILDVGCGHGILSVMVAKSSPNTNVLGIDPSKDKIVQAKKLARGIKNLEFKCGYLENLKAHNFDAIIIADVVCLMPTQDKLKMLKRIKNKLKRGGMLIFKDVEKKKSFFYYFMIFEEFLMAKVFKLTFTNHNQTYLMTKSEYKTLLQDAGFKIKTIKRIKGHLPYPHILFICS